MAGLPFGRVVKSWYVRWLICENHEKEYRIEERHSTHLSRSKHTLKACKLGSWG